MKFKLSLLGISTLLLCLGCTGDTPRSVPEPPASADYLALIPEESNFVIYANLEAMRRSPLGQELQSDLDKEMKSPMDEDEDYREFVKATGVDFRRDVYELWAGGHRLGDDFERNGEGGAILRGKFNPERILEYVRNESRRDLREQDFLGFDLYTLQESHEKELSFSFMNKETAVVGREEWVKKILDHSKNEGRSVMDNAVMAGYINDIPQGQHCWGVLNVSDLADRWAEHIRHQGSGFKGSESIENMETFVFYTHFEKEADVNLKGIFSKSEEAELVAEMLNGFKAMAKLLVSDDREAVDMLSGIKITSTGNTLEVTGKIGKKFVDKVEEKRGSFAKGEFKLL